MVQVCEVIRFLPSIQKRARPSSSTHPFPPPGGHFSNYCKVQDNLFIFAASVALEDDATAPPCGRCLFGQSKKVYLYFILFSIVDLRRTIENKRKTAGWPLQKEQGYWKYHLSSTTSSRVLFHQPRMSQRCEGRKSSWSCPWA